MCAVVNLLDQSTSKSHIKGFEFERLIDSHLRTLSYDYFRIFHDILLPTPSGRTTQIDFLIISVFGIFVVEAKHMSGLLEDTGDSRYWSLTSPTGTVTEVYSPVIQNNTHIMAVRSILQVYEVEVNSMLVFPEDLKVVTNFSEVFTPDTLIASLRSMSQMLYLQQQVSYMYMDIAERVIYDKDARESHNKLVDGYKKPTGFCLKCKKKLTKHRMRTSKTLCPKFPKCEYRL